MISGLSKFTSVRHVVSVSTLDLVVDESLKDAHKANKPDQLQAATKQRRRSSASRERRHKKSSSTQVALLEEGDYPSLRIDVPSETASETLKRDLYEDGYGQKFANQRMCLKPTTNALLPILASTHF